VRWSSSIKDELEKTSSRPYFNTGEDPPGGKKKNTKSVDFGTGSLALGGGIGQSEGGWVNALDLGLELGELARQYKVYETYGVSAETVENALKNGLYVHTNGKIYSQKFRGNQYISSKSVSNSISTAKFARNLGRGMTVAGLILSGYQLLNSQGTMADYARFTGSLIIIGTSAIPIAGPFISIGLGIADSFGVFDPIYNYFGK